MTLDNDDRDPIEILAEEFLEKHRNGETVTVLEYEDRFPEFADEIREVFPALLAMEVAKPKQVVAPQIQPFDAVAKGQVRKLGDFRIIRKIAHGGMGIVYEAEEMSLGRKVAIKVLASNLISDKGSLERFKREAKTIARLHHTNIVSVFGAGNESDLYYFVMEYIDGKSLERLVKSGEFAKEFKDNWDRIAEVVKRIALALRHAHEKNVLHRDVKPGNILIDSDGKPWITDFGLAKFEENDDLTRPGDAVGTLRYMAPEQLKGLPDQRSDIFGLGLVLYEMLVCQKAYGDSEAHNLLERISNRDLAPPSKLNPKVPKDLEMIALKAISRDPNDRYQKALELADDLDRWQSDLPIRARPLTAFESTYRWAKRNPVVATLSSIVILLFVVLVVSFSLISFSWMKENGAKMDAEIARSVAENSKLESEKNVQKAMEVLDHLVADLAVFNQIGKKKENGSQSFLFSPMGGIPVSRKTEIQLDLINDFYRSVGQTTDIRDQLRYRRFLAHIRSCEIDLHLKKYEDAKEDLNSILIELREDKDPELVSLKLYAGDLIGYANLQSNDLVTAKENFESQLKFIESSPLEEAVKKIERGKAYLGLGLVAHSRGNVRDWHDQVLLAIGEFESLLNLERPSENPVAAVFLARCYLNIPPRFSSEDYPRFFEQCKTRAVDILYQLHHLQLEKNDNDNSIVSLLFFYDYCEAVSSLPSRLTTVELSGKKTVPITNLLEQTISECEQIVEANASVPAFRFALAKCQVNLAMRLKDQFHQLEKFHVWTDSALLNFEWLTENYPDDPGFLTENADLYYKIGVKHLASRDHRNAKASFQKTLSLLEKSIKVSSGYPKTQVLLPNTHRRLAYVFDELNEPRTAAYHRSQESTWRKRFPHPDPERNSKQGAQEKKKD